MQASSKNPATPLELSPSLSLANINIYIFVVSHPYTQYISNTNPFTQYVCKRSCSYLIYFKLQPFYPIYFYPFTIYICFNQLSQGQRPGSRQESETNIRRPMKKSTEELAKTPYNLCVTQQIVRTQMCSATRINKGYSIAYTLRF